MAHNTETFLAAWFAWDNQPGNADTANAFEDQCFELAQELHITATELRITLSALRNMGYERDAALAGVIDAYANESQP